MKSSFMRIFISSIISLKSDSKRYSITLVITTCLFLAASIAGHAATIRVDSMSDDLIAGDGFCTLREAIDNANTDSDGTLGDCRAGAGADKVRLAAGPPDYLLSLGQLTISDDLTVQGNSASKAVIDANGVSRVFLINGAITVKFLNVTLTGGNSFDGGAFFVPAGANVTITKCALNGNTASNLGGGAILNHGGITIKDASVSDNTTSSGAGAGIRNHGGTMYISNSDLSDNHVSPGFAGGAILNSNQGHMTIHNSTFTANTSSSAHGAAIENNAFLSVSNSDFSLNVSGQNGGAIRNAPLSSIYVSKSTFSDNTAGADGGALYNHPSGGTANMIIDNSDLLGNVAGNEGGGIYNGAQLSVVNKSTITTNSAADGGGVFNTNRFSFLNSTNTGNSPNDCAGTCP